MRVFRALPKLRWTSAERGSREEDYSATQPNLGISRDHVAPRFRKSPFLLSCFGPFGDEDPSLA